MISDFILKIVGDERILEAVGEIIADIIESDGVAAKRLNKIGLYIREKTPRRSIKPHSGCEKWSFRG